MQPFPQAEKEPTSLTRTILAGLIVVGMLGAAFLVLKALTGEVGGFQGGVSESDALAGEGDWTTFTDPDGIYTVDLPGDPKPVDSGDPPPGQVRVTGYQVSFENSFFRVSHADFDLEFAGGMNAHRLLYEAPRRNAEGAHGTLVGTSASKVSGHDAVRYTIETKDGVVSATVMITDNRLYYVEVFADEAGTAGLQRVEDSFRFE